LIVKLKSQVSSPSKIQLEFSARLDIMRTLHSTQVEHTAALRELLAGQEEIGREVTELGREVTAVRQQVTAVRVGIRTIVDLSRSTNGNVNSAGGSPELPAH
jgi:hypothetical protein